ncbi:MAG: response regulator transcription factor [Lachnospiraceae bacterium]|nr:response regulator transcription factor [Lachnospiraceae bacterium]
MSNKQRILIVDDDENIAELISLYLIKECFDTKIVYDGESALEAVKTYDPHLILLDAMLPGIDGYEVCGEVRKTSQVPIIMVSAKGEVFDKVLGLKMGADDYIVKPFDANELSARVSAVLRRATPQNPTFSDETGDYVSYDQLIVNITNYTVVYMGEQIDLPPKELELLYFLAESPNQVFTRDQLLDSVWGFDFAGDSRTVDVHIKRLREKFTNDSTNWSISTVWGVGYKFEVH